MNKANETKMHYYDAAGNRVPAGDPRSVRQYLADDANRPDASDEERLDAGAHQRIGNWGVGKQPELLFYNVVGERVPEPVTGGSQWLADDPRRPDAPQPFAPLSVVREV